MYHIKHDQRAIRSANTIYEALILLMGEKEFEAITVSDLVDRAQVGRATFYRNFDAIEDVLRWQCDQVVDEFVVYLNQYIKTYPLVENMPFLKPALRFFYLHSTIIEMLIAAGRVDILHDTIQQRMVGFYPKVVALLDVPLEYLDYWGAMRSSMAVSVLIQWIKTGKQQAPDDLANGLAELMDQMNTIHLLL